MLYLIYIPKRSGERMGIVKWEKLLQIANV